MGDGAPARRSASSASSTFRVKCGESDTTTGLASCPTVGNVIDKHCAMGGTASFGETTELTGGEHIVGRQGRERNGRARNSRPCFDDYKNSSFGEKTDDLSESQPTKGNIRGGLTTIEEKALGNMEKLGKNTKFVGCLKPAEAPTARACGSWIRRAPPPKL